MCGRTRREAGCSEAARAALATVDAGLLKGAAITTPRPQRFGLEQPAPYAVVAFDADQSRPEATSYFVKREWGHD